MTTHTPPPACDGEGRAVLRDYAPDRPGAPTVVVVPSLINPPTVLDLAPGRSLLRWLAEDGFRPLLVDWRAPEAEDCDLDLTGHVERLLLPLLARLPRPPLLVGYCLGGTMALAAAAAVPVAGLVTIAAPWRFAGYGEQARAELARLWAAAELGSRALGLLPMEVLQAAFWQLDPARTVAKFEALANLPADSSQLADFVRLEDWANAGPPLPHAAAHELFTSLIGEDASGAARWRVGGETTDPALLPCPAVQFVASGDRIVPAATAAPTIPVRTVAAGHVGMVAGSRALDLLWRPLATWLQEAASR